MPNRSYGPRRRRTARPWQPAFLVVVAALSPPALAQTGPAAETATELEPGGTRPLWEVGIAGFGAWNPDYPAADENSLNGLALPYVIYRGEVFRAGEGGVARGLFIDSERLELDISLDGSFPVDSGDNDDREGMDDLDLLGEIGPQLTLKLLPEAGPHALDLGLPIRAVLSTDFSSAEYQGFVVNPELTYRYESTSRSGPRLFAGLGPIFGFNGLNDYFYEVREGDVQTGRPRYRADDGYLGTELTLGAGIGLTDRMRLFAGAQLGYWQGSANDDSPLFQSSTTLGIGFGLTISLFESERQVRTD